MGLYFVIISVTDISDTDIKMTEKPYVPLTQAVFHILLALAEGDQHGYRIMRLIDEHTNGRFRMGPGTLYGSIKRMLEDGLIIEVVNTETKPETDQRRRYYRLTGKGRQALQDEAERINLLAEQLRAKRLVQKPDGSVP
jgi:DNA-binding PadR family transcriptional regulator